MLKEKFLTDGIPATTWEPQKGRGIVAARLRGIGKHNKSIILLSHMDVVPANPKEWEVPPFSGLVKDGEIWGRGALDDKGPGVIELMAMLAIKRAGILLNRDVLFVATGDEEEGGSNGAGWFVDHEASVFADAGFLLNEGGGIHALADNKRKVYVVSVTEKTPLWLKLTASGPAGHASDPPAETAVTRLVRALDKLSEYKTPIHVIGPVQDYYHTMAMLDHGPKQQLDLAAALKDPAYQNKFLSDPSQNARVRDTITPTVLSASQKTNVISETAYAEIDCRLLPGSDPKAVMNDIKKAIGDDSIKIDTILNFPPISSPSRSPLMTAIDSLARVHDQAGVVPSMVIGFTDSHYFRQKKIVSYGFHSDRSSPGRGQRHSRHQRTYRGEGTRRRNPADGTVAQDFRRAETGVAMIRAGVGFSTARNPRSAASRGDRRRARAGGHQPRDRRAVFRDYRLRRRVSDDPARGGFRSGHPRSRRMLERRRHRRRNRNRIGPRARGAGVRRRGDSRDPVLRADPARPRRRCCG